MKSQIGYDWCSWKTRTCLLGRGYMQFPPMPSIWGPSLARIASDSWDFLLRLIFAETRVESKLSSGCTWQASGDFCSDCIPCSLWKNSAFLGYVTSSFWLELAHWLLGCWLRGGVDEDTWIHNTSLSSLSLLVSWSRTCICLSFLRWRLSIFSRQLK